MKVLRDIVPLEEVTLSRSQQRAMFKRINKKMDNRQIQLLGGLTKDRPATFSKDIKVLVGDRYYNRLNHLHGMTHPNKNLNKRDAFYRGLKR